jgi:hypothetical protein
VNVCVYFYRCFYKGAGNDPWDHLAGDLDSALRRFIFKKNVLDRHIYSKGTLYYLQIGFLFNRRVSNMGEIRFLGLQTGNMQWIGD